MSQDIEKLDKMQVIQIPFLFKNYSDIFFLFILRATDILFYLGHQAPLSITKNRLN